MARDQEQSSCSHAHGLEEEDEDDYIDMEVNMAMSTSSCSINPNPFSYAITATSPPHQAREFEFQMSSSTACHADELFYKGKLLPLHLPPRLQMVQTLVQLQDPCEEKFPIFSASASAPPTRTSTPFGSCNISPAESCRVSCELNPSDVDDSFFFEWSNEVRGFINHDHPKKHNSRNWSKKLKQIKQSSLCQRIRTSSRAFLRSLFSKSGCSDESCAKASVVACNAEAENLCREREFCSKYTRVENKKKKKKKKKSNPIGEDCINDGFKMKLASAIMKDIDGEYAESNGTVHRKSFSGAIQRHSGTKCTSSSTSSSSSSSSSLSSSSSSFSFNLNGLNEFQLLKRSSSAKLELESWVEGAIAHCKQSQHTFV